MKNTRAQKLLKRLKSNAKPRKTNKIVTMISVLPKNVYNVVNHTHNLIYKFLVKSRKYIVAGNKSTNVLFLPVLLPLVPLLLQIMDVVLRIL